MATTQQVPPIARGYPYRQRVIVTGPGAILFPAGCQLRADVRSTATSALPAGTLTTTDGSIVRVDDATVDIYLSGAITAGLAGAAAHIDFVRTDVSPDEWLDVRLQMPVVVPITAPGSDV